MPATTAHPIGIIPFLRFKRYFSPLALIIGSIIPDFEHFLLLQESDKFGHTIFGIFIFDLPLGLFLYFLSVYIFFPVLLKITSINTNFSMNEYWYTFRSILLSLLIGIIIHIVFDSFTSEKSVLMDYLNFLHIPINVFGLYTKSLNKVIWQVISLFGTIVCSVRLIQFLSLISFKVNFKNLITFLLEVWAYFVFIFFFRIFYMEMPTVIWIWGISIVGCLFYAFLITSVRWYFFNN